MSFYRRMKMDGVNIRRIQQAIVCGVAGWFVAIGLIYWGGAFSRYIPGGGTPICAFLGATIAGYVLANGFGRSGGWGKALAVLSACAATILGTIIGGSIFAMSQVGNPIHGAGLAIFAIADGTTSIWVILTRAISMIGVDGFARWGRYIPNARSKS